MKESSPQSDFMQDSQVELVEEYLILLLGVVDAPVQTKFHVEKELFLLSKVNDTTENLFQFQKHYEGPYSQLADDSLESPLYYGKAFDKNYGAFSLSAAGKEYYFKLVKKNKSNPRFSAILSIAQLIRGLYDKLSKEELALLIYKTYPEYTKYSNISGEILDNKKNYSNLVKSLISKGIINENRFSHD